MLARNAGGKRSNRCQAHRKKALTSPRVTVTVAVQLSVPAQLETVRVKGLAPTARLYWPLASAGGDKVSVIVLPPLECDPLSMAASSAADVTSTGPPLGEL